MTASDIYRNFKNKEYELTLESIDKYLSQPNARLTDDIMLKGIYSLIFIGEIDKAYEKVNEMAMNFPKSLSGYKIASLYIQCGKLDEANNILQFVNLNKYQAFSIAKQFYFYGLYNEAKKYFYLAKQIDNKDEELMSDCNFFIGRIKSHKQNERFIAIKYNNFKLYQKINPGHIVLAKNSTENCFHKRGIYLIWKDTPGNLLSFPLSSRIDEEYRTREESFIIGSNKYPQLKDDKRIKNISIPINEDDIDRIIGKLSIDDYNTALSNIYKKFAFVATEEQRIRNSEFIKFFRERVIKIKPDDIILVVNHETNLLDHYRVLDYEEDSCIYTARKLIYKNDEYFETDKISLLGIETPILNVASKNKEKELDKPKQKIK